MTRLLFQAEGLPASYHCLKVPTGLLSFSRSLALEASGIGVAPRLIYMPHLDMPAYSKSIHNSVHVCVCIYMMCYDVTFVIYLAEFLPN